MNTMTDDDRNDHDMVKNLMIAKTATFDDRDEEDAIIATNEADHARVAVR